MASFWQSFLIQRVWPWSLAHWCIIPTFKANFSNLPEIINLYILQKGSKKGKKNNKNIYLQQKYKITKSTNMPHLMWYIKLCIDSKTFLMKSIYFCLYTVHHSHNSTEVCMICNMLKKFGFSHLQVVCQWQQKMLIKTDSLDS